MNKECIKKYGVVLRRLQVEDLEMVRHWRNHPKVSQHMVYRQHITEEMQIAWFSRINNAHNYYFIIEWESRSVGLINIRDINETDNSGEAGVFFWDDACLNSDVPPRSSLAIYDFAYEVLGLRFVRAQILKSNIRAIRFNKYMGYRLQAGQEAEDPQLYHQSREDFFVWRNKVAGLFEKNNES